MLLYTVQTSYRSQMISKNTESVTLFLLGGGGKIWPHYPCSFLHNTKSIGLRLNIFWLFLNTRIALLLGLKPGIYTKYRVLKRTAWMIPFFYNKLNLLTHFQLPDFDNFWKAYDIRKQILQVLQKNVQIICINPVKRNFQILGFSQGRA